MPFADRVLHGCVDRADEQEQLLLEKIQCGSALLRRLEAMIEKEEVLRGKLKASESLHKRIAHQTQVLRVIFAEQEQLAKDRESLDLDTTRAKSRFEKQESILRDMMSSNEALAQRMDQMMSKEGNARSSIREVDEAQRRVEEQFGRIREVARETEELIRNRSDPDVLMAEVEHAIVNSFGLLQLRQQVESAARGGEETLATLGIETEAKLSALIEASENRVGEMLQLTELKAEETATLAQEMDARMELAECRTGAAFEDMKQILTDSTERELRPLTVAVQDLRDQHELLKVTNKDIKASVTQQQQCIDDRFSKITDVALELKTKVEDVDKLRSAFDRLQRCQDNTRSAMDDLRAATSSGALQAAEVADLRQGQDELQAQALALEKRQAEMSDLIEKLASAGQSVLSGNRKDVTLGKFGCDKVPSPNRDDCGGTTETASDDMSGPSSGDIPLSISGVLCKEGNRWPYRWVDRLVEVEDNKLIYSAVDGWCGVRPRGILRLTGATSICKFLEDVEDPSRTFSVGIYRFQCETPEELERWV